MIETGKVRSFYSKAEPMSPFPVPAEGKCNGSVTGTQPASGSSRARRVSGRLGEKSQMRSTEKRIASPEQWNVLYCYVGFPGYLCRATCLLTTYLIFLWKNKKCMLGFAFHRCGQPDRQKRIGLLQCRNGTIRIPCLRRKNHEY